MRRLLVFVFAVTLLGSCAQNGIKKEYYEGGYSEVLYEDGKIIKESKFNSSNKKNCSFEFDKNTGDTIRKIYYDNNENEEYQWWAKDSIESEKFYFAKARTYSSISERSRNRVLGLNSTQHAGDSTTYTYLYRDDIKYLIIKRDEKYKIVMSQSGCKKDNGEWCDCPKENIDWYLKNYISKIPKIEIPVGGVFTDNRDGKEYKTIKIEEQVWMAENLAFKPETGNYWAYNNDKTNVPKYGYLYDWETAIEVCPVGWHLPSAAEFRALERVSLSKDDGVNMLKSNTDWATSNEAKFNGNNESGFNGLPSGFLSFNDFGSTSFNSINLCAIFWGSEKYEHKNIENRALTFRLRPSRAQMSTSTLTHAFSVRCVKD